MPYQVTRFHDFSAGHRVVGHEGKCRFLHGHNYRIHFTCQSAHLDDVGRVIDFSVIKRLLCEWLEENWDHKFLAWDKDRWLHTIFGLTRSQEINIIMEDSLVWLDFNPTAENMAKYLVQVVGPAQLIGTGVVLVRVVVDETRKCSASFDCVNVGVH